jgi:lysophospholipase L1-like esterase
MRKLLITISILLQATMLLAQDTAWHTPSVIEGVCISDTANMYHRLPAALQNEVRPIVWNLSLNTAGEFIHFRSAARSLVIKYGLAGRTLQLPHMPATGVSGLDLYVMDQNGQWNWAPPAYRFGDTCVYTYKNIGVTAGALADYYLYLPLYNTVNWLSVGTRATEPFEFVHDKRGKPIVAYGTSIMQGAVASRPGLAWTNILSRNLDRMVINLGFSGNGKAEKPVFDHMAKADASLYIFDCMPNLTDEALKKPAELESRIRYGVTALRKAHPDVPVLFAEYPDGNIPFYTDTTLLRMRHDANIFMTSLVKKLQSEGIGHLFLLTEKEIGFDINSLTEATHPNNIGMMQYAQAYEKKIREILQEPTGALTTQQPVQQYRDGFNWLQRHAQVIENIRQTKPAVLLFGNSIINYWGGEPAPEKKAPVGDTSWKQYMQPNHVQNAGFGNDRIENVLWRVYHGGLDAFTGNKIVVMIGTNNLAHNTDPEIVEGLSFLLQQIALRKPAAQITIVGILPRKGKEDRVRSLNKMIKKMARRQHVGYADFSKAMLSGRRINTDLFQKDGLHPNEKGYEVLGKNSNRLL